MIQPTHNLLTHTHTLSRQYPFDLSPCITLNCIITGTSYFPPTRNVFSVRECLQESHSEAASAAVSMSKRFTTPKALDYSVFDHYEDEGVQGECEVEEEVSEVEDNVE